mmetsp:Transcript_7636/g.8397  ORF Transcript_7636/g.8397 Transcript_7636/m.8397 type:complete len:162 (+) Transcript_7636:184-669(+)
MRQPITCAEDESCDELVSLLSQSILPSAEQMEPPEVRVTCGSMHEIELNRRESVSSALTNISIGSSQILDSPNQQKKNKVHFKQRSNSRRICNENREIRERSFSPFRRRRSSITFNNKVERHTYDTWRSSSSDKIVLEVQDPATRKKQRLRDIFSLNRRAD